MKDLRAKGVRVKFDKRDTHKPGWKFNEYELKGCAFTYCYWS